MKWLCAFLKFLLKYEKVIFVLVILVNLIPVLVSKYTLTVDGPSHLYNARLIVDLLDNPSSTLSDYFIFNNSFSPNWSGHLILAMLLKVFPAYIAEKILIISYFILFPLGVRLFLKTINSKSHYFIYFIFPFTHSFLFYYGFYNFHIGLVLLFFTLAFWFKNVKNSFSLSILLKVAFLSIFLFFSHVFIFATLLLVLFVSSLTSIFNEKNNLERKLLLHKYLLSLLAFIPSIVCFVFYLLNLIKGGNTELNYLSVQNILGMFYQVEPAKALLYSKETIFTKWIFILVILFMIYHLYDIVFKKVNKTNLTIKIWRNILLVFVFCVFLFPNGTPEFGFITTRFILVIYLFLFIYFSTLNFPRWLLVVSLLVVNYVNVALVKVYFNKNKEFSAYAESYIEASQLIRAYSTVLPINYASEEWLNNHSSNYLGVDKPIVIKDNYEAYLNYFPLKWNPNSQSDFHLQSNEQLLSNSNLNQVDYVYTYGMKPNQLMIDSLLTTEYKIIYKSIDGKMKLYMKD